MSRYEKITFVIGLVLSVLWRVILLCAFATLVTQAVIAAFK